MKAESELADQTQQVWLYLKKLRGGEQIDQKACSMLLSDMLPRLKTPRLTHRVVEALRKYNNDQIIEAGAS